MSGTFHRRPLPEALISFTAPEGRRLLREALAAGTAEAFFPLVAHLHTQAEPAWCGLGTLVTVLNALEIDPGRVWKGPWRWFGEELLTCCKSLDATTAEGVTLGEVACLARCNGAEAAVVYADAADLEGFRAALVASVQAGAGPFLVANYDRGGLAQTGSGHFSPLAAWHAESDRVLVLDVARFKYPPHWTPVPLLWEALRAVDPASGRSRGWIRLQRAEAPQQPVQDALHITRQLGSLGVACPAPPPGPAAGGS